jgi:hypothetical protein
MLALLLPGPSISQEATGTICLAPTPTEAQAIDARTGNRRGYTSYDFSVRIDKGKWHAFSKENPTLIAGITREGRHLLSIRDGDRLIESFWFRFDKYETAHLCLWHKPWYQTWSLGDAASGGKKCRCLPSSWNVLSKRARHSKAQGGRARVSSGTLDCRIE